MNEKKKDFSMEDAIRNIHYTCLKNSKELAFLKSKLIEHIEWELLRDIEKANKEIKERAKQIQALGYINIPEGSEEALLTGNIPPEWFPEKDQEEYALEYNKQDF